MSTTATNAITALLADTNFNGLVADLKTKRDEIVSYQNQLTYLNQAITQTQANLADAQTAETQLQQAVLTAGAALIAAQLPQ